jgi:hypothetical protein
MNNDKAAEFGGYGIEVETYIAGDGTGDVQ